MKKERDEKGKEGKMEKTKGREGGKEGNYKLHFCDIPGKYTMFSSLSAFSLNSFHQVYLVTYPFRHTLPL